MANGYNGRILWIDLNSQSWNYQEKDEEFFRIFVGGGLLAAKILLDNTPAAINPLSSENLLIFTSSVMAGHEGAGLPRFTVSAKSPLTGGIGETRCEGPWGIALKNSGADAIVISGVADQPQLISIDNEQVSFLPADQLWGKQVGESVDILEQQFGIDICPAVIGPAGENLVRFASIVTNRTFQAARMGMGAVMGAKKLKALVIHKTQPLKIADSAKVKKINDSFRQRIVSNDLSLWQFKPPGFSCWLYLHGLDAALCVKNYTEPIIAGIENFKEAREAGDIGQMAQLYREHVIQYTPDDTKKYQSGGQIAFFQERGRLRSIIYKRLLSRPLVLRTIHIHLSCRTHSWPYS